MKTRGGARETSAAAPSEPETQTTADVRELFAPLASSDIRSPQAIGSDRLAEIGLEFLPYGKWDKSLTAIGKLTDAEWEPAQRTLRAEVRKLRQPRDILHPRHIADYLADYRDGIVPGQQKLKPPTEERIAPYLTRELGVAT